MNNKYVVQAPKNTPFFSISEEPYKSINYVPCNINFNQLQNSSLGISCGVRNFNSASIRKPAPMLDVFLRNYHSALQF